MNVEIETRSFGQENNLFFSICMANNRETNEKCSKQK